MDKEKLSQELVNLMICIELNLTSYMRKEIKKEKYLKNVTNRKDIAISSILELEGSDDLTAAYMAGVEHGKDRVRELEGSLLSEIAEQREAEVAGLRNILNNPEKWMKWCDIKVYERCQELEKEVAELKNALIGYKMPQQIIDKDKEIASLKERLVKYEAC